MQFFDQQADELRGSLARPPQTNEVGRAGPLVGALWHLQSIAPLPVRLFEMGASGGLNLLADRFRFEGARQTGPVGSPVVFADVWLGNVPATGPLLDVVERLGCDRHPVDSSTDEGALTLTSYVWPDQLERLARLRGALTLARASPVTVVGTSAADFAADLAPAAWRVDGAVALGHVAVPRRRGACLGPRPPRARRCGGGDDAPLAHIAFEPKRLAPDSDLAFYVTLQTWPGGPERTLGVAPAHGLPVEWA